MLSVNHLSINFDGENLFSDVNLKFTEGNCYGVIGANGAGKSTTIRTLMGLIRPTGGSASIFDLDCHSKASVIARDVGYLPSENSYYENMKVRELLQYTADLYGMDCKTKMKELADRLNLDLSRKIADLSLGNKKKVGIVTTGSEVQKGLITDTFTPVLRAKFAKFPSEVIGQTKPGDDMEQITADILKFIEEGADMVVCSGGMSVDPDDRTPGAIKATGTRIVSYGAPVLPGAMMLVSYYEKDGRQIPILGLPGCVMYAKNTIFDLLLPRLMADDEITLSEINQLGEGGLCLNCDVCTFPNCGFGK